MTCPRKIILFVLALSLAAVVITNRLGYHNSPLQAGIADNLKPDCVNATGGLFHVSGC